MAIESPMEILELADGESRVFTVLKWELGEALIHPTRRPAGVNVRVLRVHVPTQEKPEVPQYWDVTSQTLIGSWAPLLDPGGGGSGRFKVTKKGVAPAARFTLEVLP